ncbi:TonB family protein [uncultured Arcobacter sp.]|uniref:energy transducer TonB n=1 Tax=uncultured Arcobacter sp. TaxID=165434 RepID=UPI00261EAFDA|nr:TonB family protein [uncultured Arcobacter sp.]
MKYIIFALILSISIHLLTFKTFHIKNDEVQDSPSTSKDNKKSAVNYVRLKSTPKSVEQKKETPKKSEVKKEIIKEVTKKETIYKKVTKNQIEVAKKREVKKDVPKKIEPKPSEQKEVTPNYAKLNPTKLQQDTLETYLATPPEDVELVDEITQSYIKLYGEEYNSYTKVQKVFLRKNLKTIGSITQKYLRYPAISVRTRQSGMNIIEFILHPNGDITQPLITTSSGYEALDKNTIKTIEIAYKDYPRPNEPTKIRIYVTYRLY